MIVSTDIQNFRGFRQIAVRGFQPLNIIVGSSAAGKTALLEALRLVLNGTPGGTLQLNAMRGLFNLGGPITRTLFENYWNSLFYDYDVSRRIHIGITNNAQRNASVDVYFDSERSTTPLEQVKPLQQALQGGQASELSIIPLAFKRQAFDGGESIVYADVTPQGQLNFGAAPDLAPPSELLPAPWQINSGQVANWFSQLSIENKESAVLKVVKSEFPQIRDLTVQSPTQYSPSLYASLSDLSHKLPLSLVSSGINKFTALLLAIRANAGGVLLVDEIENGIFYRLFEPLWRALNEFAIENNTQLFLSTHSLECLKAAARVIEERPADFALIQLVQDQDNKVLITSGKNAAAAITGGLEVRG